jgi:hypothetical protein
MTLLGAFAETFLRKSPSPSPGRAGLPWTAHYFPDYLDQWQTETRLGIGIFSSLALPMGSSETVFSDSQTSTALVYGELHWGCRGRYASA